MNGQQGNDQGGQSAQESHLSYLLNSANGQGLMGYPGAAALANAQRLGYGVGDASLEEQILQRASALRAEALLQQQQQAHQRQQHLGAALAALQQQQQQFSSFSGLNPNHFAALSPQEQEALLSRAAALRELGISGGAGAALSGGGMDRFQQMELGRFEELERRRQQLAALAGLSGATNSQRPGDTNQGGEQLGHDSAKSEPVVSASVAVEKPPTTNPEKTKEDLRKTPGTVIVPCRARGMPMDHNFKTAYFVISEDAKHGEDLVCSYFACRNGGVKFRYCAHCMAPVAKRNFCRRHDHGMSAKNGELKDEEDDDASMDESYPHVREEPDRAIPTKKVERSPQTTSLDVLSKAATSTSNMVVAEEIKSEGHTKRKKLSEDEEEDEDEAELAIISKKRRKMWSALLVKRPRTKDPRHLSSWLNEVLTVSDFETPLDQLDSPSSKPDSASNNSPKKSKPEKEKDNETAPKKEKKVNGEKKKRKSDKLVEGEKGEGRSKKEKGEVKPREKKIKLSPKDKLPKVKDPSKPKDLPKKKDPGDETARANESEKDDKNKPKSFRKDGTIEKEATNDKPEDPKNVVAEKPVKKEGEASEKKNAEKKNEKEEKPLLDVKLENGSTKKGTAKESTGKKDDEDGFAGTFADWRDRKKEKALKKGPSSLKR